MARLPHVLWLLALEHLLSLTRPPGVLSLAASAAPLSLPLTHTQACSPGPRSPSFFNQGHLCKEAFPVLTLGRSPWFWLPAGRKVAQSEPVPPGLARPGIPKPLIEHELRKVEGAGPQKGQCFGLAPGGGSLVLSCLLSIAAHHRPPPSLPLGSAVRGILWGAQAGP